VSAFNPAALDGAYRRDDGTLYGRPQVTLYGAGSGFNEGAMSFEVRGARARSVILLLVGLDDELPQKTRLQVLLNGRVVFDGPNDFPNVPNGDNGVGGAPRYWGRMEIPIPVDALQPGVNRLTLRNATPGSTTGVPYMLISNFGFSIEQP
jgi:hypothetical protein